MADTDPVPGFTWITQGQAKGILGKARPKTLAEIEGDAEWDSIFQEYVRWKGADVEAAHAAWKADPQGDAREALKKFGGGNLRADFYNDLKAVKDWARESDTAAADGQLRTEDGIPKDII